MGLEMILLIIMIILLVIVPGSIVIIKNAVKQGILEAYYVIQNENEEKNTSNKKEYFDC